MLELDTILNDICISDNIITYKNWIFKINNDKIFPGGIDIPKPKKKGHNKYYVESQLGKKHDKRIRIYKYFEKYDDARQFAIKITVLREILKIQNLDENIEAPKESINSIKNSKNSKKNKLQKDSSVKIVKRGKKYSFLLWVKGKKKRFSFNTYEEALEYLRKMQGEDEENITLEKGIELYRQYLLSRKQNARVVNEILLFLRPFVRILGNISFNEVTEQKLQYYIFRRLQEKSNRTGQYISEQTIKRELTTLSACWNFLLRNGYINTQNFAYKILKEKKFSDKKRERVLSYEENIRFLKAVMELGDDRYNKQKKGIILVGYLTGARRDEIFRLRKEHVRIIKNGDVFSGMIHFTGDITKTGKPRKIDIPYSFALFLLNIQPGSIYVFPDYQTEYAQKKFSNWFHKEFLKKAGIENFVFHDLRHNWATISEEVGASVLMIKALGGWNSMNSVGRYINPTRIEQNPMNKFLAVLIKEFQEKDKLDGGKDEM